jgi:exonuclease SbcC
MILKKIKIKNIRSYENSEIIFPEGNILLSGEIGSGKTSILLAIEYALFGLQPGQTGSALLRSDSDFGEVILEFEVSGKNIIIERRLKRTKTVVNDYSSYIINGEKIECSITELKSKIISLLGYPSEFIKKNNLLYKYTIYTPQEQMKQIILEDPDTRLNILRHIFGVEKYKTIRENLQILIMRLKDDSKYLQGETSTMDFDKNRIMSAKSFIEILNKKIDEQKKNVEISKEKRKKIENSSTEIEKNIKEKENFEKELEKANVLLNIKKDNIVILLNEKNSLIKQLKESETNFDEQELQRTKDKIIKIGNNIDDLASELIDSNSQIRSLENIKQDLLSEKDRIFKIDICPTCLQDVPTFHKHNILNKTENNLSTISAQISDLKNKIFNYSPKIESLKEEKSKLEKVQISLQILKSKIPDFEKLKARISEIEKSEISMRQDIDLLERHMATLKESILNYSRFQGIYKSKQEELKNAFQDEKKAEIYLAELKKESELTLKEIKVLESTLMEKEEKKKKNMELLELIDWLTNHFMGLINYTERTVMYKLRKEFSKLFNKWFSILVQDTFETQIDENFTPIILQGGAELDFSYLSGGERTAVALAYRLALNQTINTLMTTIKTKDIIILDEPTEGFSEAQINKLRDIFIELNAKQLIIVSHEQKIEGFVDKIIKIKKSEGISSAEQDII